MPASAPKVVKTLSQETPSAKQLAASPPASPMDQAAMAAAILQLQSTVNELIVRHNELAGAGSVPQVGMKVTGAGQAASNLFTAE